MIYKRLEQHDQRCELLYKKYFRRVYGLAIRASTLYSAAMEGDEVVGCMGVRKRKGDRYFMLYIIVHPDHRKKGIAKGLVKNAIKYIKDDAKVIYAKIDPDDYTLQVFYDLNFVNTGKDNKFKVLELTRSKMEQNNEG